MTSTLSQEDLTSLPIPFLKPHGTGLQIASPLVPALLLRSSLWATSPQDTAPLLGQAHRHSPPNVLLRPSSFFLPLPSAPQHASRTTAQAPSRLGSGHLSSYGQPSKPQEYPLLLNPCWMAPVVRSVLVVQTLSYHLYHFAASHTGKEKFPVCKAHSLLSLSKGKQTLQLCLMSLYPLCVLDLAPWAV